ADHIRHPVFATYSIGVVVWSASYLPFGGVHVSSGTPIDLRFSGQWFLAESGLHQNWMRDYDPTTGRYIQADPLGLVDGPSVYGYALQNPGRYVDPRGENAIGAGCLIGGSSGGPYGCAAGAIIGGIATIGTIIHASKQFHSFWLPKLARICCQPSRHDL
ncbi:MAG: RHS repeat-associated protein, partial [Paracoccaceae bacterium]